MEDLETSPQSWKGKNMKPLNVFLSPELKSSDHYSDKTAI